MNTDDDMIADEFMEQIRGLERHYLVHDDPIMQSGYFGGAERWRREREIVLAAVERDGDLLDVGCANGYLLECLVQWAGDKGIGLTPYGVDIGARLIEEARRRLPAHADHFWVGDAWTWQPPRSFQYVYTLHDCVPSELLGQYARRLLSGYVSDGGRLIIGAYGSGSRNDPAVDVASALEQSGLAVAGAESVLHRNLPITRIAWIDKQDLSLEGFALRSVPHTGLLVAITDDGRGVSMATLPIEHAWMLMARGMHLHEHFLEIRPMAQKRRGEARYDRYRVAVSPQAPPLEALRAVPRRLPGALLSPARGVGLPPGLGVPEVFTLRRVRCDTAVLVVGEEDCFREAAGKHIVHIGRLPDAAVEARPRTPARPERTDRGGRPGLSGAPQRKSPDPA